MLTVMGCMLCCVDSKGKGWCGVLTVKTWCVDSKDMLTVKVWCVDSKTKRMVC